jgi:alpha-tubulin suppressor-like RCC1 family protein
MVAAALGTACEQPFRFDSSAPPAVASVAVSPESLLVVAGETASFAATVRDSAGNPLADRAVTWTSSDPAVMSIGPTGVALAQAPGLAFVIAAAEGRADTASVVVVPFALTGIASGGLHTCAAANTGGVWCWGFGLYGQLGGGFMTLVEAFPAPVAGSARFLAAAAGSDHTCGQLTDSTAACWGRNSASQLGRGASPGDVTRPGPVAGATRFAAVAAGAQHTCAVAADSAAWCWGGNGSGQLGDSQAANRSVPAAVAGGHRFGRLAAGALHSCAVTGGGTAWCWGADDRGQLGDSAAGGGVHHPVRVRGASGFHAIAAGGGHSCGLIGVAVVCWGDNTRGQLGTGAADSFAVAPVTVAAGFAALSVTAGGRHTCALAADSTAHCWGANDRGQVGDGSTTDRPAPVPVAGARRFVRLSAGGAHTCGVASDGTAYCWGEGTSGQLGHGRTTDSPVPVAVSVSPSGR